MDCELFLLSDLSHKSLGQEIESISKKILNEDVTIKENTEEIHIAYKYFSMDIEIEDISDIEFIRSHYELNVNKSIRVLIFGNTFNEGLNVLFKVIGKLMNRFEMNLLLLENGSDQLIRKENDILIVNTELDQYQSNYLSKKLLELLDYPYIERKLSKR
ncbi:hypothetical protein SAMN04488168_11061 [Bacillus sp. 491mf]|uniref:hypothetical protein n=1 Tax=unclassified Bacillus (in: firmicutes) TaxID=185979 RepID=UPI00054E11AA|nr:MULTISPECIES: hypothetical protein [unclassified Bacillus (in: firmicutes)]SFC83045.1 hypothetical protein SAMN04488168_11061 [Bacillus sp. 491mf]